MAWHKLGGLLLCCGAALVQAASDSWREQQYASEIAQTSTLGQAIWLEAEQRRFLSLVTPSDRAEPKGAAILLHDLGEYPDQPTLIHPLRERLARAGWFSIAPQLPLREAGAPALDYLPLFLLASARIQAALDHAREQGITDFAIVGYGWGALMGLYFLDQHPEAPVVAFVAISVPVLDTPHPAGQTLSFLERLQIPVFDFYASLDWPEVKDHARERRVAARANPHYQQLRLDGQSHHYLDDHGMIAQRVYSWLARHAKSAAAMK